MMIYDAFLKRVIRNNKMILNNLAYIMMLFIKMNGIAYDIYL